MPKKSTINKTKKAASKTVKTKKVVAKKSAVKKTSAKNSPSKKVVAKKSAVKKTSAKKSPSKKSTRKKSSKATSIKYEEAKFLASIKPYALKKNEKYMNARQRTHFMAILVSWAEQLKIEQSKTVENIQENISNFPDESDRATHEEEFTLELRTRERERKLLSKINESIDELKTNDYGYCASCGIEIGIRRLEARPTATRCIDCKTIEEIHERQQFG